MYFCREVFTNPSMLSWFLVYPSTEPWVSLPDLAHASRDRPAAGQFCFRLWYKELKFQLTSNQAVQGFFPPEAEMESRWVNSHLCF